MSRVLKGGRFADFLPEAQAVAETEAAPLARTLIVVLAALLVGLVGWAALARVDRVASAPGVVRPAGEVKIINHPEGGRIAALLVAEGDRVTAGQKLVALDPVMIREETARRTSEYQSLVAEYSRLEAESRGIEVAFPYPLAQIRPDLARTQTQLFLARRQALASRRAAADRVIEQRAREVALMQGRLAQLRESLTIIEAQERAIADLTDKGYFPKLRYLSIRRQVSEAKGTIAETRQSLEGARAALGEARSRRSAIDEEARSDVLTSLNQMRRERDRARSALTQGRTQLGNLVIRAPIAGIVQDLKITAVGQAIRANEPLMQIVPTSGVLIVEARVSNDDIGYITPGQRATVKIRTYDFVRFGTLDGVVERIAADAGADQRSGERRFKVMVRTSRAALGPTGTEFPVQPGMQADVDLHIGKRSILGYLTDRLSRTAQTAFRER
jgi:membrane fusion protein, adhesin transport system